MSIFLLLIFLALVSEAFFSGAETAFISINFLKLMHLIEKKNKRAMLVHNIIKKPERLLTTTLLGANLSVVVSAACATAIFEMVHPQYSALLATLVLTPISFIFCQLLPKTIFRYHANRLALYVSGTLDGCEKILLPFVNFFTFFGNSIAHWVNPKGLKKNPFITKDEIKSLIKDISREGILEDQEKEAIDKIFDMTLTKALDVMVPLKNVVSFDVVESLGDITDKSRARRFTRFPVFNDKELIGVLNIFDIFYNEPPDWHDFIRPLIGIEYNESVDKVFSKMQPNKEMMAAVYRDGLVVGVVTIDDLMENIASKLTPAKKA